MAKINQIEKTEAIDFVKRAGNRNQMIDNIVASTFYGQDYEGMYDDAFAMSKLCRAFNITAYGKANRIKNRYRKYLNKEGAEEYMRKIIAANYPGFRNEEPRMDDLLAQYPEVNIFEKAQPVRQETNYQPTNNYSAPNTDNSNGVQFPVEAIPVILLIIAAIVFLKWKPVLFFVLLIIAGIVIYQLNKGKRMREAGQVSPARRIVLGVLGIFFAFLVITGIKGAMVDDSESLIMVVVYGILAVLCFRGAAK